MMTAETMELPVSRPEVKRTFSLPLDTYLLVVRSMTSLLRTPEALLPPSRSASSSW